MLAFSFMGWADKEEHFRYIQQHNEQPVKKLTRTTQAPHLIVR